MRSLIRPIGALSLASAVLSLLSACWNFANPVDPDAPDYQGYPSTTSGGTPGSVPHDLYVTNLGGSLSSYTIGLAGQPIPVSSGALNAGPDPVGATIGPNGSYLYVANYGSSAGASGLSAYSIGPGGALTTIGSFTTGSAGSPNGIAISPNGAYLYVTNSADSTGAGGLSAYSIGSGGALASIGTYATDNNPALAAISPNGAYLYVTNSGEGEGTGGLSAFSIGSGGAPTSIGSFTTGPSPYGIAITPSGDYLYVTSSTGAVSGFSIEADGALAALSGSVATGSSPEGMAISPNGGYLYVANYGSSNGTGGLSAFSIGSGGALTPVPGSPFTTGAQPSVIAISPDGSYLYVTNSGSAAGAAGLSAYSIGSGGALTPVPGSPFTTGSAGGPSGAAVTP